MSCGGGYPLGAQYDPRAPYNEVTETCPECDGEGVIYMAWNMNRCSEERVNPHLYSMLPKNESKAILRGSILIQDEPHECTRCDGAGYIVYHKKTF